MRSRVAASGLFTALWVLSMAGVGLSAGPIPPGRQHRLTIEGESTVTFIPEAGLPPIPIEYVARIEYIIDTRFGKETRTPADETKAPADETKAPADEAKAPADEAPAEKPVARAKVPSGRSRTRKGDGPASKATGAVDLSLHSSEMSFRQGGQTILETKITRSRFQGRLNPESPVMSVTSKNAPPMLQDILKRYDTITATMAIDDDHRVISRKFRIEGPRRAVTETILSIHAPIPKGSDSWNAPTQLAMGHGQTAKGTLLFEKDKDKAGETKPGESIKVKVSGVLKAEGVIAGRFIKDGTYTVTGEQTYDTHTREWTSSRWSVVVANELANPAGQTIAHVRGTMTVRSQALGGAGTVAPATDGTDPKL